jgi:hypothetical protein
MKPVKAAHHGGHGDTVFAFIAFRLAAVCAVVQMGLSG